jgi:putative acetyltransferase
VAQSREKAEEVIVRFESTQDHEAIRQIHIAAFANHPYSHQTDHLIVDALRAAGALTASMVAEVAGEVVGHIAYSPVVIGGRHGSWFVLGPVGVLPARQRQGIGSRLVVEGLNRLRKLEAQGCVLVGDPAYYTRFGFRNDPRLTMEGVPPEVILCLPLSGEVPRGEVEHHAAFFVQANGAPGR